MDDVLAGKIPDTKPFVDPELFTNYKDDVPSDESMTAKTSIVPSDESMTAKTSIVPSDESMTAKTSIVPSDESMIAALDSSDSSGSGSSSPSYWDELVAAVAAPQVLSTTEQVAANLNSMPSYLLGQDDVPDDDTMLAALDASDDSGSDSSSPDFLSQVGAAVTTPQFLTTTEQIIANLFRPGAGNTTTTVLHPRTTQTSWTPILVVGGLAVLAFILLRK
jgi:hypothetical protein